MNRQTLSPAQLSELDQSAFTDWLAHIFEKSPWVAQRAWLQRPFDTVEDLHRQMVKVVQRADISDQRALIQAHPELAGRQARAGTLTASSTLEQRGAGLDQCTKQEQERLNALNARYRQKFGFGFIIAVKGLDRQQIIQSMEERLNNSTETEFHHCLNEIARIARFRLDALFASQILTPEPLTAKAFQPFGQVIQATSAAQRFTINDGNTERYHDLAALDPGADGRIIVSLFRAQPRTLPFTVTGMECHPLASQAFIPLNGKPWLVVVAPAGQPPTARNLRVFSCEGDQGINYSAGVWHHPVLALDDVSDFIVLDRDGPGSNCDIATLPEPAIIQSPPSQ